MDRASLGDVRRRAMTLWSLVSAATAGLLAVVGPTADDLLRAPGADFADLLVQVCAATALLAGSVLWLATTDVALGVLRSRLPARRLGPLRSALLAACGVAVLTTTAPASAATLAMSSPARTRPASCSALADSRRAFSRKVHCWPRGARTSSSVGRADGRMSSRRTAKYWPSPASITSLSPPLVRA